MSSVTLLESAKLSTDMLVSGVIENIVTVNQFYDILPFEGIEGNSLAYNRENALGDTQVAGVGATITAKNPATFSKITSSLTTIIGDAEVNGLIQATRSNQTDQQATQVASKAKSCGRSFQDMLINGTGTSDQFPGLLALVDSSKVFSAGTNGANFDFAQLDTLIDTVVDKDGQLDYFMMNSRTIRAFMAALRALGGASINDVITLPSGRTVPQYRGVPIFRNDYIPVNQTQGSASTCTSIIAGTVDDGSMTHGIAGLTAMDAAGIHVVDVGEAELKDERITRVKWYCGLALYSLNGLAVYKGILN
jgi:hypothetical protein